MSKRNRATRRNRHRAKVKLHSLAALAQVRPQFEPRKGTGPAYICGQYQGDGLTPFKRKLIAHARSIQSQLTAGEVQHSHMMVQEHWGWQVHAYNPALPPHQYVDGIIKEVDDKIQSARYSRIMREERTRAEAHAQPTRTRLAALTNMRDRMRQVQLPQEENDDV